MLGGRRKRLARVGADPAPLDIHDLVERLGADARQVVVGAASVSRRCQASTVEADHLLVELLLWPQLTSAKVVAAMGADPSGLVRELLDGSGVGPPGAASTPVLGPSVPRAIALAIRASDELGDDVVGTEHLLVGALAEATPAAEGRLRAKGVTADALRSAIRAMPHRADGVDTGYAVHKVLAATQVRARHDPRGAVDALVAVLDADRPQQPSSVALAQNLLAWLVAVHLIEDRYAQATVWIAEARAIDGAQEGFEDTQAALAVVTGADGDPIPVLERTIEGLADQVGDELALTHAFLALALLDRGDIAAARAHVAMAADRAEPIARHVVARLDELDGRWEPPAP